MSQKKKLLTKMVLLEVGFYHENMIVWSRNIDWNEKEKYDITQWKTLTR